MTPYATIYYDVNLDNARSKRSFLLRFSSCIAFEKGLVPFRSESWNCSLPNPNSYIEDSVGTAETRGIVGGIHQPILAAQSEAIERALGDALVLSFTQVLDLVPNIGAVLVRGPVFPKTLGRFLSMRPSDRLIIAWVMSLTDSQTHPMPMLFPLTWYEERSMAWDSEMLINSFTHPESSPAWTVEFLNVHDNKMAVEVIKNILDNYIVVGDGKPRNFWCARQLLCQSDQRGYVFEPANSKDDYPEWIVDALTSGTVVGTPAIDEGIGVSRNLVIFPWKT